MSNGRSWGMGLRMAASAAALSTALVFSMVSTADAALPPPTSGQVEISNDFTNPQGIAVDGAGNLYVADAGAGVVDVFDNDDGTYPTTPTTTIGGGTLVTPTGVAVDAVGNVYVTDPGVVNGKVYLFPSTGPGTWGPAVGLPFGGTYFEPIGIAVDLHGNVYVTDPENGDGPAHVLSLKRDPSAEGGYDPQQALPIGGLVDPEGVAVDAAGNVYVTDASTDHVILLPKTGRGYGRTSDLPFGGLNGPEGVAVSPVRGPGPLVYVVDTGNSRVKQIFSVPIIGFTPQTDSPFGGLQNPTFVAVSSNGSVFVTDSGNDRVLELPAESS